MKDKILRLGRIRIAEAVNLGELQEEKVHVEVILLRLVRKDRLQAIHREVNPALDQHRLKRRVLKVQDVRVPVLENLVVEEDNYCFVGTVLIIQQR